MHSQIKKERNSNFELLRIIAMLFIVIYHLLITVYNQNPTDIIYKGAWIPLHIGVILIVFISGYFGIKCKVDGILKLVGTIALYYLPLTVYDIIKQGGNFEKLLFISHSPYWFIKTYLYLYLFSPVLNKYLEKINNKDRLFLVGSLTFISVYIGFTLGDSSLNGGKNLVNFCLLYVLGNTFKAYEHKLKEIPIQYLICSYLILNCCLLSIYTYGGISKIIWRMSFYYNSPLLIINAALFFLIIARIRLHSSKINYIASSMFAVYLIHCQPYISDKIETALSHSLSNNCIITNFCIILLYAVTIMATSVLIDKTLGFSLNRIKHFFAKTRQ